MRGLIYLASALAVAGPAAGQKPAPVQPPAAQPPTADTPVSATAISYSLPSSSVKVAVSLTLTKCVDGFEAKPEITFVPAVGPNPYPEHRFTLDGRNLSSFWKNKKIAIETYPSGSLKSLNGALADQTGSIISSVVKLVGTIVALEGDQPIALANHCNAATLSALSRVQSLTARIGALRTQYGTTPPAQLAATEAAVNALAAEVARLQTGELHVDLSREFVLEPNVTGGTLLWRRDDFAKWLAADVAATGTNPPVSDLIAGVCIAPQVDGRAAPTCDKAITDAADVRTSAPPAMTPRVPCPGDDLCATTIVLREPRRATITVVSLVGGFAGKDPGATLKRGDLVISQWGTISYLPLKIGFGKSVNFAMAFDENGHKVSQTWDSTARGTGLLGGASAIADATIGAYRAIDGQRVAEQKAEVDRLNTMKAYNQARFCAAVIEAGGFTCP